MMPRGAKMEPKGVPKVSFLGVCFLMFFSSAKKGAAEGVFALFFGFG